MDEMRMKLAEFKRVLGHGFALNYEQETYLLRIALAGVALAEAMQDIAVDPPVSESPTIEGILDRAQSIARTALATYRKDANG